MAEPFILTPDNYDGEKSRFIDYYVNPDNNPSPYREATVQELTSGNSEDQPYRPVLKPLPERRADAEVHWLGKDVVKLYRTSQKVARLSESGFDGVSGLTVALIVGAVVVGVLGILAVSSWQQG
jgi:hypothetical protein